jgi:glyceraldehyde-3-phosphate dehydrogenase (NADP+)
MNAQRNPRDRMMFVGGRWVDSPRRTSVIDPFTKVPFASVATADERVIDDAIAAAHEAFGQTRRLAPFERSAVLAGTASGIAKRRDEFVETIVAEAGKPITLAEAEVARAVVTFTAAAEEARRTMGELLDADGFAPGRGHAGIARRFPVGVVYGITPFNFPLNLVAHKVAPAIASGNTIVVKPSPRTPLSAQLLAEVMDEAGLPKGALNVVVAPNELAARPLADDRVRHVSFTGSVPVGWSIKQQAGRKRVTLELGGNAGLIVHEDADLAAAIPAAAAGGFGYAGQSCISVQRIVVHAPIYERFKGDFVRHVREQVQAGDPRDRRTLVGPLIDDAAAARVRTLLDDAVRSGAKVLCGAAFRGNVLDATVLEDVDPRSDVCTTEAFAPIVTLHRYADFDEALRFVNDSEYGLQAGVYTRDVDRAWRAFETLEVGGVMVNQVPTYRIDTMPYGGVKSSGLGREGVRYAMEEMTEVRVMVLNLRG